jgi:hypothetical protein
MDEVRVEPLESEPGLIGYESPACCYVSMALLTQCGVSSSRPVVLGAADRGTSNPWRRFRGAFVVPLARGGEVELRQNSARLLLMTHRQFDGRDWSRHYSRWSDWRPEDDWGPITAAVMFLIILAGLIFYGSGVHL